MTNRDRCYTCKGTGGDPPSKYAEPHGSKERVEEQLRIALEGHPDSRLWGHDGLIAATMRCVESVRKIEDLLISDMGTDDDLTKAIRAIILPNANILPR